MYKVGTRLSVKRSTINVSRPVDWRLVCMTFVGYGPNARFKAGFTHAVSEVFLWTFLSTWVPGHWR